MPVACFALLFPLGASRNYGMLSTFITPLVLILIDFGGGGLRGVAADRLLDTVLGAATVLVVGYLLWPGTWRPKLGRQIADGVDALADYADVAFGGGTTSVIGPVRRRAFGALADVRSDLQSLLAEPTRQARAAANWFPLVAQLEQTAEDLRDAAVLDARVPEASVGSEVQRVAMGLRDLASAVREQRSPADLPLPDTGILLNVAGDLLGARRILTGPPTAARA
ncbi:FUSC family protein [Amnibacterium kyonggiense]